MSLEKDCKTCWEKIIKSYWNILKEDLKKRRDLMFKDTDSIKWGCQFSLNLSKDSMDYNQKSHRVCLFVCFKALGSRMAKAFQKKKEKEPAYLIRLITKL